MLDEVFGQLKSRLEDELRKIVDKGDISARELENATKAVCLLEKLESSEKMSGGYSENSYRSHDNSSYRRGRNQNNGQYMSRGYHDYSGARTGYYDEGNSGRRYNDGGSYGEYSGHSTKDRMIAKLEQMMDEETGEYERGIIQKWLNRLEG